MHHHGIFEVHAINTLTDYRIAGACIFTRPQASAPPTFDHAWWGIFDKMVERSNGAGEMGTQHRRAPDIFNTKPV